MSQLSVNPIRKLIALRHLAVALVIALASSGTTAKEVLNLSSVLPLTHWLMGEVITKWAKDVERETQGEVVINLLPAALGKQEAHFDLARDGISDISLTVAGYTPGRFVLLTAGALPNVGLTAESTAGAMWRMMEKSPDVRKEFNGVVPLTIISTTGLQYWSRKPATSLADLKGMKIHLSGAVTTDVAIALGATPVLQPISTAYETLANGVVDAIFYSINGVDVFNLGKVAKNGYLLPGGFTKAPFLLVMNPKKFEKLSQGSRDALMRLSGEHLAREIGRVWEGKDRASLERVRALGVKIEDIKVGTAAHKQFIAVTEDKVVSKWLDDVRKDRPGVDGRALLEALRKEAASIDAAK